MDLDLAELLASLAIVTGADRAVSSAAAVIGAQGLAPAVPLLQPLALSAATRHAIAREDGLLAETRSAAAAASGLSAPAAGPPAAGQAAYLADHRRLGRRLLLRLAPARGREQQLARPAIRALGLAAGHHRLLRRDLPGQRGRADRRRARPGSVLAHDLDAGRLVVRQPGLSGQRRRHGTERPVPAKKRRLPRSRRRGGRSQRPDGGRRSPDPAGHLLRPGQPSR